MAVPFWEVWHKPKGSDTATQLTKHNGYDEPLKVTVKRALNAKATIATIMFKNTFQVYRKLFKDEDTIQVYSSWDGVVKNDDLLINLSVNSYNQKLNEAVRVISVKGMDRTYMLLNNVYMTKGFNDDDNKDTPTIIKKAVLSTTHDEGRQGYVTTNHVKTKAWVPSANDYVGTFENVNIHLLMKTCYEWIKELSNDPYTRYSYSSDSNIQSDRGYIFWVDEDNDLHWVYPSQSKDFDIIFGQNNILEVNMGKSVFDVYNMVIFNGGDGLTAKAIKWYFWDRASEQPQIKIRVQPMKDIARDLAKAEIDAGNLIEDTNGQFTINGVKYKDKGYPFTTTWGETVNNDDEYIGTRTSGFKGKVIEKCYARSKALIRQASGLKWKGTVVMKGTRTYSPGHLVGFTYPDYNMKDVLLRVNGVTHQLDKNGWITTLDLQEDESAIVWD